MAIKTCTICGNIFETMRPNKKYCSFSCKEAGRILKRKRFLMENPGYYTDYMKSYRKNNAK